MTKLYIRLGYSLRGVEEPALLSTDPAFNWENDEALCCVIGEPAINDERIELKLMRSGYQGEWKVMNKAVGELVELVSKPFELHITPHSYDADRAGTMTVILARPRSIEVGKQEMIQQARRQAQVAVPVTVNLSR